MKYLSRLKTKDLEGTAILRLDFNTADSWRMEAALPTIRLLVRAKAKVLIVSHRGRPEGPDPKLSLAKDARLLARWLKQPVRFLPVFDPPAIREKIQAAKSGAVFMLENLRFNPGEEKNDADFARKLADLGNYFVNDAFPVCHRSAASVVAITECLPSYAGLVLEKEIEYLDKAARSPKKPLVVVIGGAKADDKLGVIRFLRRKADSFLLGGASANTLLFLSGTDTRASLRDQKPEELDGLREILGYKNLILPRDCSWSGDKILDIGPETRKEYVRRIKAAGTVIWSGPMGCFEKKKFAEGNLAVARAIAANRKAVTITGGGETVMFLRKHKLDRKFSFISTGGGAMIDLLAGKKLPGIEALAKNDNRRKMAALLPAINVAING